MPRTVIYDPELTLSLPFAITVTSALNAIAHAAEGLYAPDGNPVVALMAEEGIRACAAALAPLRADPSDPAAHHGGPVSLAALGMPAEGLDPAADMAADLALNTPYPNPRPLQRDALRALLQRAFEGAAP